MAQTYTNLAQTVLGANYTAGSTTMTLQSTTGSLFPSTGNFTIAVNNPPSYYLLCTARSGDTLTVNATATEGTTAVSVPNGTPIAQVMTAGTFNSIRSDISGLGTYANLPVSGMKQGDWYTCTDTLYRFTYTGSVWQAYWRDLPCVIPSGVFNWDNQGSSTLDTSVGCQTMLGLGSGTYNLHFRYQTAPSTPYHITCMFEFDHSGFGATSQPYDECAYEIGFRDAGGKIVAFGAVGNLGSSAGSTQTYIHQWSSSAPGSLGGSALAKMGAMYQAPYRIRIEDDGTNLNFYANFPLGSNTWNKFYSQARGSYLTTGPTTWGWGTYTYSTQPMMASLVSMAIND